MNRKSIISCLVLMMVSLLLQGALAGRASAQITINLLDGTPKNGLSERSFLRNALITNPLALAKLIDHKLTQELVNDPYMRLQLSEPRARAVMEEIIKCALPAGQLLTYVDDSAVTWFWSGELGLCTGSEIGDWATELPSAACQELVTACVMARVNGRNASVPLAMRGDPTDKFLARSAVATEKRWRERVGNEDPAKGPFVESFSAPYCLIGHECMWAPAYVGKCPREGELIRLAIESPTRCAMTPIRVCAGLHGCNKATSATSPNPAYAEVKAERVGACLGSPLSFSCPYGGYYSVMTRPTGGSMGQPVSPTVIQVGGQGTYPASEAEVFPFLEGAFYGNFFQPDKLSVTCRVDAVERGLLKCTSSTGVPVSPGCAVSAPCPSPPLTVPYLDVYACFGGPSNSSDANAAAYFNDRICAQRESGAQCFPYPPVRCSSRCLWQPEGGYYEGCKNVRPDGTTTPAFRAITTLLNDPCDLILSPGLCTILRRK